MDLCNPKTESYILIQYVNGLYSLNEGLFSVAQSLFAHMHGCWADMQTHRHMAFAKPISGSQVPAVGVCLV